MKKKINIIGAGPCALLLALELDLSKYEVAIFEKNYQVGRKFLVAGDGGLNITHSENPKVFVTRYFPIGFLDKAFEHFTNTDLINWLAQFGISTYVGSSGRVFPNKSLKPIAVLSLLLDTIIKKQIKINTQHIWMGFKDSTSLSFLHQNQIRIVESDITIFCLGGVSWPITGSTGDWKINFENKGIRVNPFEASNCAFKIDWPQNFADKIEGKILKNCLITCRSASHLGEVVLTRFGIEGSGIYPLSRHIRHQLTHANYAEIVIDLKPNVSVEKILLRLGSKKIEKTFTKHVLSVLNLNEAHMQLLKQFLSKDEFLDISTLAKNIKGLKLRITSLSPIEEAISTVGGIDLNELNENFEFTKLPNNYAIGEMLDYDAPTGGYLLQSCFSMAKFVADYLNNAGLSIKKEN